MKLDTIKNHPIFKNITFDKIMKIVVYIIFACIIFYRHTLVGYESDDVYTSSNVGSYSLQEYFIYLIFFNGRIATDLFANVWYRFDLDYWRIFDTSMYVLTAMLFSHVFTKNKWVHVLITCILVLLFPFKYMSSAGYIATSANYFYTIPCLLFILCFIKYILDNQKIPKYMYLVVAISILYATNHDQTAIVTLVGLFSYYIYCRVTKQEQRLTKNVFGLFLSSTFVYGIYFIIPGHLARMSNGTLGETRWLPEFVEWTFWDKVYHGYSTTIANLFYNDVLLFTIFAALLLVASLRQKCPLKMFVGFVPFAGILLSHYMGKTQFVSYPERCYGMTELMEMRWFAIPFILSVFMLICIFAGVWFNVENIKNRLFLILLLVLAAGTREMMGFSPTIYASSYRTFTFFLYALIGCNLLLLKDIEENEKDRHLWYIGIGVILSFFLKA